MALLDADVMVLDQVTSFMRNDFAINAADGAQVGSIHTEGSAMSRMFLGSRKLAVHDADSSVVVRLDDVMTMGRDRFSILDGEGREFATLVKEFTFFRKRLSLMLSSGEQLDVQGDLFDFDYQITGSGGLAAQVSRRWPGLGASLLGRDRYVLSLTPGLLPHLRAAVVATVIALDLIRQKDSNAASSSSS